VRRKKVRIWEFNGLTNNDSNQFLKPEQFQQYGLEKENLAEVSTAGSVGEDKNISVEINKSYIKDNQSELEEIEKVKPGHETTVILEPCHTQPEEAAPEEYPMDKEHELEVKKMMELLDHVQDLEKRILQLENKVEQLQGITKNCNNGIIPLDGNMVPPGNCCKPCSIKLY